MKPAATPRMTVLHQSPVGLRSIVTSLAAFLIIVSSISLLFQRGQEAQVQMAVEHRNQEKVAVAEHHDQQEAEMLQFKVAAADEHHDQQVRGNEAAEVQLKVAAADEHHDQQVRGNEAAEVQLKVAATTEHHDQQPRGNEAAEVQLKVAATTEHHDQQLRGSEAEVQWIDELQEDSGEEECNWSTGRWVYDNESRPLYSGLKCSFIFPEVACDKYGRKDAMYQHWRWQPHGCDLPR
jgi:hypothetical protein